MRVRKINTVPGDAGFSNRLSGITIMDVVPLLIALAVGVGANYLLEFFPVFYGVLASFLSQFLVNLLGVILIAGAGVGLYILREFQRILYGAIEVSFSLAYGWYAVNKAEKDLTETIGVIAAVYLVVRGIDNIMQGLKAREEIINAARVTFQEEG